MDLTKILAFIQGLAPILEPMLLQAEQNTLQPAILKAIDEISSPDLKEFLLAINSALDSFIQSEIKKLG